MTDYEGTYLVWGPPGTGKTTWLSTQVKKIALEADEPMYSRKTPCLVCSLTRTAAAEVAGRDLPIPPWAVGTLHAHAFRAIGRPEVAEGRLADWNEHRPEYRITDGGPVKDLDEPGTDQPISKYPGDELLSGYGLLRARMADAAVWPRSVRDFAAAWEAWKTEEGLVDFTDMIENAIHECGDYPPGNPDVIIADEAQDHSALEYTLLRAWGRAAGALIVTGDPYQALYVWRGAHPEMFIDPDVPATHRRVLSQSYRVPGVVHRAAMKWIRGLSDYRELDYKPRGVEGELFTSTATWQSPGKAVRAAQAMLDAGKSVMFAASCGYMLGPLIGWLKNEGVPFANPWRRRHGGWNPLGGRHGVTLPQRMLDFLRPDFEVHGSEARRWTREELSHWTTVMRAAGTVRRGGKTLIEAAAGEIPQRIVDTEELLRWFEETPIRQLLHMLDLREPLMDEVTDEERPTLQQLVQWWSTRLLGSRAKQIEYPLRVLSQRGGEGMLAEPKCYVGTVHSFKGAEADCVFLFPDLSSAGYSEWRVPGKQRDSVIRLIYVGMTRARETLVLCDRAGTSAVQW